MSKPEDLQKPAPESDENFLRRWARRKEAARAGQPVEEDSAPPVPTGEHEVPHDVDAQSAPSAPPELPPLESLTEESDFSAFMHTSVSPDLRRQALRKLFSGAKYAAIDPLDPFRTDFTDYLPLGDVVTADMKFHAERLLREQLEKVAGESDAPENAPADEPVAKGEEPEQAEDDDERHDV